MDGIHHQNLGNTFSWRNSQELSTPVIFLTSFRRMFLITGAITPCTFCVSTASPWWFKWTELTHLPQSIHWEKQPAPMPCQREGEAQKSWRQDSCRNKYTQDIPQTHQLCVSQLSPHSGTGINTGTPCHKPLQLPIFALNGFSCLFFPGSSTILSYSTWDTTNIIQHLS